MQQVICDVPYRDEFIVRWRVQLRKNRSALSTFVEKDSPSSTGQRKVRLSEGRPILVTFHLFLVLVGGTNIFSELISSLKIAKLCFETTAAHATIIKRTQLSFLPLREPGGTPPSWMDRKRYPRIKEMNLGLKKCKDTQNTSLD